MATGFTLKCWGELDSASFAWLATPACPSTRFIARQTLCTLYYTGFIQIDKFDDDGLGTKTLFMLTEKGWKEAT